MEFGFGKQAKKNEWHGGSVLKVLTQQAVLKFFGPFGQGAEPQSYRE